MKFLADIICRLDHARGKLDVMLPAGKPPFPVVVVIHGGTIRCMLPVCGVHDIGRWYREKPEFTSYIEAFLGGTVSAQPKAERDSSPVTNVHRHAPPCLAIHGEQDATVPFNQSVLLVQALRAAGAVAELLPVAGVGHAACMPGTDEPLGGKASFQAFFRKHLS